MKITSQYGTIKLSGPRKIKQSHEREEEHASEIIVVSLIERILLFIAVPVMKEILSKVKADLRPYRSLFLFLISVNFCLQLTRDSEVSKRRSVIYHSNHIVLFDG